MSTSKLHTFTITAATLVGVAILGTGALFDISRQQDQERKHLEAMSAQAGAERVALQQRERAAAAKPPIAASDVSGARGPAAAAAPANADAHATERLWRRELLATNAEYRPIRQQEMRLHVQREYGAFFALRGYSPQKIEALTQALALIYDAEDLNRLAHEKAHPSATVRPDPNLAAETRLIREKVAEFLGPEEADQMNRFILGRRSLGTVRDFNLDLSEVGCPLTPVQETALAMALGESRDAVRNPNLAQMSKAVDPATGLSSLDRWQIDRAKELLTAEQLRRFEHYLREEEQRAAIAARFRS